MHAEIGKKVKGVVSGITGYGAFVKLENGSTGMIHISQVADVYVSDISQHLSVGQEVEPTVLSVDEKGRIALSLKSDRQSGKRSGKPSAETGSQPMVFQSAPQPKTFEDMLSHYRSTSEEKIGDLRKFQNGGRSAHKRRNH